MPTPTRLITGADALGAALAAMYRDGHRSVSAASLADYLWPAARHMNSHGQTHNMAAGVAGRMLRRHRGATEVSPRCWEIVPEFLPPPAKTKSRHPKPRQSR